MRWIVENYCRDESVDALIKALRDYGAMFINITGDYKDSDLDIFRGDTEAPLMFSGSIQMTKLIRESLPKHKPVAYCTMENYACSKYYGHYGEYLFNDNYVMIPLSELKRRCFFFYGVFGRDACIFVRPDGGDKPFGGAVVDLKDFNAFFSEQQDTLVVVSSPKNIRWEGRFVVSNRKEIITQSTYRYQGNITRMPAVPHGSKEFVQKLLDVGYFPDPVFVMDICEDNDGKFWLLELNAFSSSGLYACDMDAIVKRVTEIAHSER